MNVYALRLALLLAGAESQVTTLWKVDDRSTRDLMVDYYSEGHSLPDVPNGNWRVIPEPALQVLAGEMKADATRNASK